MQSNQENFSSSGGGERIELAGDGSNQELLLQKTSFSFFLSRADMILSTLFASSPILFAPAAEAACSLTFDQVGVGPFSYRMQDPLQTCIKSIKPVTFATL
jgi:hypothetical protein